MFKQEYAISRGFATALLVLCTLAMILSNYIFTKDIAKEIDGYLMQHEYQKIGGEENYRILQELQKREILSYLDTLKREQPEVIDEILASISEAKNDTVTVDASKLDIEAGDLDALLEDTSVYGGTGAMVTLLEFSDFECPYCKEQHMSGVISELRDIYGDDLQYAFKNFPLAQHTHAMNLAIQAKCIEKLGGSEAYLGAIDTLFTTGAAGAEALEVSEDQYGECVSSAEIQNTVEREFGQGRYLGVISTPSVVIIDNGTGEYQVVSGNEDISVYGEKIDAIISKK